VFFKENQVGPGNPHDHIAPDLSAMILRSHVTDGVAIAKRYRIPKPIQAVIRSHHGDTMAAYFYGKANQAAQEQGLPPVSEAAFRYPGPRPKTKEEAVLMLADTIEAASRTLREHTPEAIRELVEKLVRGKLADGQLDDSPLTLRDLGILIESFIKTLSSTYHERIEYPDLPKQTATARVHKPQAQPTAPVQRVQLPPELQEE
jgi:membrane-associated HD superfamily phosphohydrolase